jgi:hypothetical protein
MSTGADSKTMPVSREYEDGFDRTFGKRDPVRGRWIYLADGTSVRAEDYTPPAEEAVNAPIMAGRFYENTSTTTCDDNGKPLKVDIGSRQRHREFMRQRGLTTADDAISSIRLLIPPDIITRKGCLIEIVSLRSLRSSG